MKNIRLLYLVQHTNKEMFKIGIATSNQRFLELKKDYQIDWNSSLYFEGENEDVCKMEKILHRLFHKNRLDHQGGTGGTEWFSSECLTNVVESILFNTENSKYNIDLKHHGIKLNEIKIEDVEIEKKVTKKKKKTKLVQINGLDDLDLTESQIEKIDFLMELTEEKIMIDNVLSKKQFIDLVTSNFKEFEKIANKIIGFNVGVENDFNEVEYLRNEWRIFENGKEKSTVYFNFFSFYKWNGFKVSIDALLFKLKYQNEHSMVFNEVKVEEEEF